MLLLLATIARECVCVDEDLEVNGQHSRARGGAVQSQCKCVAAAKQALQEGNTSSQVDRQTEHHALAAKQHKASCWHVCCTAVASNNANNAAEQFTWRY